MAKVLGEAGRYVSQEAVKRQRRLWSVGTAGIALVGFVGGFVLCIGFLGGRIGQWVVTGIELGVAAVMVGIYRFTMRRMTELEQQRFAMAKGAAGEQAVGAKLGRLPEEYKVINNLTTPFGNVDHVVVGPTGVFLLDTKNWRGVVAADGKGELLTNGKPTDKPHVRQFTGRVMGIKEKVRPLAKGRDPFFQAVFVFPSARVDANWGTTGSLHCIRDEQVCDYILETKFRKKLSPAEGDAIAQAFLALAHMDMDFTERVSGTGGVGKSNSVSFRPR
jgi:hypothetical protein